MERPFLFVALDGSEGNIIKRASELSRAGALVCGSLITKSPNWIEALRKVLSEMEV